MWNNKCDNIIAIHAPNWHSDKKDTLREIHIQKIKDHRLIGKPGEVYFNYDFDSNRFIPAEKIEELKSF